MRHSRIVDFNSRVAPEKVVGHPGHEPCGNPFVLFDWCLSLSVRISAFSRRTLKPEFVLDEAFSGRLTEVEKSSAFSQQVTLLPVASIDLKRASLPLTDAWRLGSIIQRSEYLTNRLRNSLICLLVLQPPQIALDADIMLHRTQEYNGLMLDFQWSIFGHPQQPRPRVQIRARGDRLEHRQLLDRCSSRQF